MLDRLEARWRADDRRAGEVAVMMYNMHRDTKKDPKGKTWLAVFPEWKEPAPVQSEDQMFNTMLLWAEVTDRRQLAPE